MCMLVRSDDVNIFGSQKVMEPLIKDLLFLEKQSVFVESSGIVLKGSLAYVSADNLGAHTLGCFNESFSPNVERICRFCMASSVDVQDLNKTDFCIRHPEMHAQQIQMLNEGAAQQSTYGVKGDSPLHTLQYYHVTTGMPPDIAHHLLEGIVPYELALCLSLWIKKNYVSLAHLTEKILTFPYDHHDRVNRPQAHLVANKLSLSGSTTIGGDCHENWTLLRLLPLMIADNVPADDPAWLVVLELKDIVEYAFSHRKSIWHFFPWQQNQGPQGVAEGGISRFRLQAKPSLFGSLPSPSAVFWSTSTLLYLTVWRQA